MSRLLFEPAGGSVIEIEEWPVQKACWLENEGFSGASVSEMMSSRGSRGWEAPGSRECWLKKDRIDACPHGQMFRALFDPGGSGKAVRASLSLSSPTKRRPAARRPRVAQGRLGVFLFMYLSAKGSRGAGQ